MGVVVQLLREEGVDVDGSGSGSGSGEEGGGRPLLVHTFSNGGCLSLISLARRVLLSRPAPSASAAPAIPALALVYDSCPAPITTRSGADAFSMVFRAPWARWCAWYAIYALLGVMRGVNRLLGFPDSAGRMQDDLLDPALLPAGAPRVYIYGKDDAIIPYKSVEEMIAREREEGKRVGRKVQGERYEGTAHVAHVRGGEGRYWAAVGRVWKEGWEVRHKTLQGPTSEQQAGE
ncbi:hypothetical protein CALCODRAFT_492706 [Calocera cornea HHB12733]|uniref:DUF829-domain-containing protein n=1 Tax=Calocera cornea HHB12733 TaxID=1353952 RepID=A0A165I556_9BASI|nr:hypothetical protein CALCODRAFT_492706 [Calocera cornea HHB12733]